LGSIFRVFSSGIWLGSNWDCIFIWNMIECDYPWFCSQSKIFNIINQSNYMIYMNITFRRNKKQTVLTVSQNFLYYLTILLI
jgi:hypothetical protein